jgi:hypothetical protein
MNNSPAPKYQLENTVVGKYVPSGPVTLEDKTGCKLTAPHPPRSRCKHCYGRGYVGKDLKTNALVPCRWCYKMAK